MDLRLNGLSFGQGDDCGGEDYVEVDGIPFCDATDVTSLRENSNQRVTIDRMSVQLALFSDEIFFLPDRNSVSVRLITEGSNNYLFQSSPWSIDFIQIECPVLNDA